jgi:hypothetical protein
MSPMTPFRYVDFYDVPRTIVLRTQGRWLLLQSAFDEELDDYEREYSVYSLPDSFEPPENGSSWKFIEELEAERIGKVPVDSIQFDNTKRKTLDTAVLQRALGL